MICFVKLQTRRVDRLVASAFLMSVLVMGCSPGISKSPSKESGKVSPVFDGVSLPPARPAPRTSGIVPKFTDMALELGVSFTMFNDFIPDRFLLPEVMGSGAAWIDVDGDGWLDLFLANGSTLDPEAPRQVRPPCRLWRNRLGSWFEEITEPSGAGVSLYGQGCAVGDFDADGFADIYIAAYGHDRLLHNQGDGSFVDCTQAAEVSDPDWTSSVMWIDVDGDGDLDLYAVHYLKLSLANHKVCEYSGKPGYCGPGNFEGVQDSLFRNLGDGRFEQVAEKLGFRADNGKGLAVAAADFDDDLIPEIYVGNDMTANFLFKRDRPQTTLSSSSASAPQRDQGPLATPSPATLYREIAQESGCAVSGSGLNEASMGIALADFESDGRCDIYLTHYFHTKNTLYKNLGGLVFDDISNWAKVTATSHESLGFGTAALDYDRDGAWDLFVSNGHVLGPLQQPNEMTAQLLRNDGGIFTDVSTTAGSYFQRRLLGRSVAMADFDNDGDSDLAVTHLEAPFALLRNDTAATTRSYLGLRFFSRSRCHPVGGKVVLKTNLATRTIPITAGGSYLAASDPRILWGLLEREQMELIEVFWPSGAISRIRNPAVNQYLDVIEDRSDSDDSTRADR